MADNKASEGMARGRCRVPDNTTAEVASSDAIRKLVLAAATDLGFYGLSTGPDAIAAIASLVVNSAKLQRAIDLNALGALREAVKPVRLTVTTADEWQAQYDGSRRRQFYALDASRLVLLLSAIDRLLGSDLEAGNGR